MLKLTDSLKAWLRDNKGVVENADDAAYTKAVADGICDGTITPQQISELTKDPDAEKGGTLVKALNAVLESVAETQRQSAEQAKQVSALIASMAQGKPEAPKPEEKARPTSGVTTSMLTGGTPITDDVKIDVITADKRYSTTKGSRYFPEKSTLGIRHPMANRRMAEGGTKGVRYIDEPSELDRAVCGAFAKHMIFGDLAKKDSRFAGVITDHDRDLMQYALHNMAWGGEIRSLGQGEGEGIAVNNRRLEPHEIAKMTGMQHKSAVPVYDEVGTSGGAEIAPIVFDDAIITTPLLHSEFYPRVNVVTIARGRRIEGAKIGTPDLTWRDQEQTADIALEDTASFVTAFDTNIHTVSGAIELGLDFLSDTPVAFGDIVTQLYGQTLLYELDKVICVGDNSAQPDGIQDVGTDVTASNAWSITALESLFFSVAKQYKQGTDKNRICWGANETTYSRIRAIATGVTDDDRLLFGMDISDYMLFGHPFLINSNFDNAICVFANLSRYRMYRRLGLTTRTTSEGAELVKGNTMLIVVRARFGGQAEDTSAFAHIDDGQT